jgi:acyl-CoA dehydrogenase
MVKAHLTDLHTKVVDDCMQLHGGAGFMSEYPIATAWLDGRVSRIYAGANAIMKELIARDIVKK